MKKLSLSLLLLSAFLLPAKAETIVALTTGNRLLTFESATPETISKAIAITGLATGERVLGIDFRPSDSGLYALGSSNRIYVIDATTGTATAVGTPGTFGLVGTQFGFDFNPVADRIRVTSDADQNLRINPNTGATITDGTLAYAAGDPFAGRNPNVVASAYTSTGVSTPPTTTLYDIDTGLETLVRQVPPNDGTLNTVGSLGLDVEDDASFDISPSTGIAYAYLHPSNTAPPGGVPPPLIAPGLFTIDLSNGQATVVGRIGNSTTLAGETVVAIAVPANTRLLNLATRGRVDNGENVLIAGFISRGFSNTRFLLRGIGPSLSGVTNRLADPVLTLFDRNGVALQTNDNWQTSPDADQITATGLAPTNPAEAAILANLPPGAYTAHVTGANGTAGIALVELYQLP